jgi:hypothetical protein
MSMRSSQLSDTKNFGKHNLNFIRNYFIVIYKLLAIKAIMMKYTFPI